MEIKISRRQRERVTQEIKDAGFGVLKYKGNKYEVCDIVDLVVITNTFVDATDSSGSSKHEVTYIDDYIKEFKEASIQKKTFWQKLMFWRK